MEDFPTNFIEPVTLSLAISSAYKVIIIGNPGVGKTCLMYRLCEGCFPNKTGPTIGVDFKAKTVAIGNGHIKSAFKRCGKWKAKPSHNLLFLEAVRLQLWDTAGQERFRKSMVKHYYRNVSAIIYVYDMTKRASFEDLDSWIQECKDYCHATTYIPCLLVGNKCDLSCKVEVSTLEAQCFADHHGMPLFETSAKDDTLHSHVEGIFLTLAHKVKESNSLMGVRDNVISEIVSLPLLKHTPTKKKQKDKCAC